MGIRFNQRFYVVSLDDLEKVSEVLYSNRIRFVIKPWAVEDDTDDGVTANVGFMFCYNLWDVRHRAKLEQDLIDAGVMCSCYAS